MLKLIKPIITLSICLVLITNISLAKSINVKTNTKPMYPINHMTKEKNGLQAEYYSTTNFQGNKFTRIDPRISFDWGTDSPLWKLKPDKFSIRWTGQIEPLYSEEYTFSTITDNGVRLWINNQLIIDQWNISAATEYKGTLQLTAKRRYNIKMEYYQDKNDSCAKLLWSSPSQSKEIIPKTRLFPETPRIIPTPVPTTTPAPTTNPSGTYSSMVINLSAYYNEDAFSYDANRSNGNYDASGNTYSADLAYTSAIADNIPFMLGTFENGKNNSIKCTGQAVSIDNRNCKIIQLAASSTSGNSQGIFRINYTDGTYTDTTIAMKDWCTSDTTGEKILENMAHRHTPSVDEKINTYIFLYTINTDVNKYVKNIVLPINSNMHILATTILTTGATQQPVEIGNGLRGEYFDNMDLTDSGLVRTDATVNFDWGTGSPNNVIGPNTFSVRWTGQIIPEYTENYTFYTSSDDGVRLWVNNTLIIDHWTEQAATEYSGSIFLNARQKYNIKLEYFDKQDKASVKLYWSSSSRSKQIIPEVRMFN